MPRSHTALGILLVALLGAYGCAKAPTGVSSTDTPDTTAVVKKLEDDYRAAAAARDQLRQKLAAAEAQAAKVQQQLQTELEHVRAAAAAEKDSLKSQLKIRTNERDAVTAQYDSFRKNLKELIGNADTAVGALNEAPAKPAADRGARK